MKLYETDNEYILDVLQEEEDRLCDKLLNNLPDNMRFYFYKFIAVRNKIEKLNSSN